jgi:hypothetical protein
MNANWKSRLSLALVAAVVLAGLITVARFQPAQAARDDAPLTGPRYTVVETEASNLIVTDNKSNTLYFYTIDKDKEIGSDLKLRGTIDLNQVGKTAITPTKTATGQ